MTPQGFHVVQARPVDPLKRLLALPVWRAACEPCRIGVRALRALRPDPVLCPHCTAVLTFNEVPK